MRILAAIVLTITSLSLLAQTPSPTPPVMPPSLPHIEYTHVAPGVTLHQSSPVLYFRGILGMTPAERDKALANKPAVAREALLKKVQEYTALPSNVRETRLRLTELQWELTALMKLAPKDQAAFIANEAAAENRPLLKDWLHFQSLSPDEQKAMLIRLDRSRHAALIEALAQWQSVPEPDRQRASGQFARIVYLAPNEREQTLNEFSDAERKTMEEALKKFAALPESQRNVCIASFQKFAGLSAAERNEFLQNAARWESMNANDRAVWQKLVEKMPALPIAPPSPPGLFKSVLYPPMPPGLIIYPPSPPGLPMGHGGTANPNR